jgi:hypothetical protein
VRGIIRAIIGAREGERTGVTFWAACRFAEMEAEGALSRDDAIDLAVDAATHIGLTEAEARRTVLSAFRQGHFR